MRDHSDLIARLRHADQHSQQRVFGSRIFGEASDALSSQSLSLSEAREEIERLTTCLAKANANHEEFERRYYLESDRVEATEAEIERLREALAALANARALRGVREVVAGWNGEGRADGPYPRHDARLGATLPKTNCGAVYELDEAMTNAKSVLENGPAGLADATNNPADSDLSSLRKGAEVAVKPLEWVTHDPDCWYARCPVSSKEYYVIREDGRWWATWDLRIPAFDTAEEGKSAAQSDFETRIRSALVSGSREDGASLLRTIETLPDDFTDDGNCCAGKLKEPRP